MACVAALLGAACAVAGCSGMLTTFAGEPPGTQTSAVAAGSPQPPSMAYAAQDVGPLASSLGSVAITPPTVAADPNGDPFRAPTSVGAEASRQPIAVTPLSSDPAVLAPLQAAAGPLAKAPSARFLLLVLTPPLEDTAAIEKTRASAQNAADAVVRILGAAGIGPDRIAISAATSPGLPQGELRLYPR